MTGTIDDTQTHRHYINHVHTNGAQPHDHPDYSAVSAQLGYQHAHYHEHAHEDGAEHALPVIILPASPVNVREGND